MLHASPFADVRRHLSRRPFGMLATVLATMWLGSAADCLEEPKPPECKANCDIEADCGFRTLDECEAASCNPLTGDVLHSDVDKCLGSADNCLIAAACACDDGCAKTAECAGSADAECVSTCDTLVDQEPKETYLENFCKLDASCADQATCGAVSG